MITERSTRVVPALSLADVGHMEIHGDILLQRDEVVMKFQIHKKPGYPDFLLVGTGRFELPTLARYASETYVYTSSTTCPIYY